MPTKRVRRKAPLNPVSTPKKAVKASTTNVQRTASREAALRQELVALYRLDAASGTTPRDFTRPPIRLATRLALVGCGLLLVQLFVSYALPLFMQLMKRPELALFQFGG